MAAADTLTLPELRTNNTSLPAAPPSKKRRLTFKQPPGHEPLLAAMLVATALVTATGVRSAGKADPGTETSEAAVSPEQLPSATDPSPHETTTAPAEKKQRWLQKHADDEAEDVLVVSKPSDFHSSSIAASSRGTSCLTGADLSDTMRSDEVLEQTPRQEPLTCTRFAHVCRPAAENLGISCTACFKTCHSSYEDPLCELHGSCPLCVKNFTYTPRDSDACIRVQTQYGCHECGREDCFATSSSCIAKCTSSRHVCACDRQEKTNCHACGRSCHTTSRDVRCEFYGTTLPPCVRNLHFCAWTTNLSLEGCKACKRTCHIDYMDSSCEFQDSCHICAEAWLYVLPDSDICRSAQEDRGCHACQREGCHASHEACHAKCTPFHHRCGPSIREGGCSSCGRVCHRDNSDPRCISYGKVRVEHADARAGTGGQLPHMSQITFHRDKEHVVLDGTYYTEGYGNPGGQNNCLIDSLRQCFLSTCSRMPFKNLVDFLYLFDRFSSLFYMLMILTTKF